uniref:Peptidase S1 domain-containing protein n=1 Tax=Strigamia maritima TaxID=126957 RepID=T1J921_STRMM
MHLVILLFGLLTSAHHQANGKTLRTSRALDPRCRMRSGSFGMCQNTMTCFQAKVMTAMASGQALQWADVDKCSYIASNGQLENGLCCAGLRYTSTALVSSSYPHTLISTHAQGPYVVQHSVQSFPFLPPLLHNNSSAIDELKKQFVLIPPGGFIIPSGEEIDLKNSIPGPPWIPGVNWPPPIPTHPPDHTIPPLPTHPPGLLPPGVFPTIAPQPPTQKPIEPPIIPGWIPGWPFPTVGTARPTSAPVTPQPQPQPQIPDDRCGMKKEISLGFKVVGGKPATKHSWRWIAGLFLGNRLFCGGSLIDSYHVLTAAHCLKGMSASALTIRLGDHDTSTTTDTTHVAVKAASIQIHPSYNPRNNQNDLALVRLASKVTYSDTIVPVCLASQGDPTDYTDKTVTVAGWGSLGWRQPTTPTLFDVDLRVWTNAKCAEGFNKHFHSAGHIVDHMICAGDFGKDSCTGDSGGPLMIQKGNQWIQLGIVSWGIQCGSTHLPGVYTRVSHFRNWIDVNRGTDFDTKEYSKHHLYRLREFKDLCSGYEDEENCVRCIEDVTQEIINKKKAAIAIIEKCEERIPYAYRECTPCPSANGCLKRTYEKVQRKNCGTNNDDEQSENDDSSSLTFGENGKTFDLTANGKRWKCKCSERNRKIDKDSNSFYMNYRGKQLSCKCREKNGKNGRNKGEKDTDHFITESTNEQEKGDLKLNTANNENTTLDYGNVTKGANYNISKGTSVKPHNVTNITLEDDEYNTKGYEGNKKRKDAEDDDDKNNRDERNLKKLQSLCTGYKEEEKCIECIQDAAKGKKGKKEMARAVVNICEEQLPAPYRECTPCKVTLF